MKVYHITLVGVNQVTGEKVLFTLALIAFVVVVRYSLHYLVRGLFGGFKNDRIRFWIHQAINIASAAFFIVAVISIWIGPNAHLATVGGLIGAGVAFALQQVIIAIAGYFVIMRGKSYSLGDRIILGGVRGQVIALDFFQTTVLEMGQPPSVSEQTDPAVWVMARQYTGRIVTISNGKIFTEPVFNYSRDFAYIWEEIHVGIGYADDYERAEQILLDVARTHTQKISEMSAHDRRHLQRVYDLDPPNVEPHVYYRMTDNWVELALRFLVHDRGIRKIKDAMFRDILKQFKAAGISIASGTYDIVGFPPIRVEGITPPPEAARPQ